MQLKIPCLLGLILTYFRQQEKKDLFLSLPPCIKCPLVEKEKWWWRLEAANSDHCDVNWVGGGGTTGAHYSVYSPLALQMDNMNWGEKSFSASYLKACQIFFFFCRVNPNLKDLKPTFALKTESLCIFWMKGVGENKIPQRYFLLFCVRKPLTLSVETIFVSNFSHLSTRGQVSWRKAPDPWRQWRGTGAACWGAGLKLPPTALCKLLLMWEIGGLCQAAPTAPPRGPVRPNGICHKSGSGGDWRKDQPRELQSRYPGGHRPCAANKQPLVSAERHWHNIGLRSFKNEPTLPENARCGRGMRNCSEISMWSHRERTFEKIWAHTHLTKSRGLTGKEGLTFRPTMRWWSLRTYDPTPEGNTYFFTFGGPKFHLVGERISMCSLPTNL